MESGELRKVQGLGVPRWGNNESQDCWMVAEGEVRVRPCGSEGPACVHPGPRLQPHLRPYSPLFIMFQLDRPFCSSNPRSLFLPLGFVFAMSSAASLLFAQVDAFTAVLLFIPMWAQKHLPQGPSLTSSSALPPRKTFPILVIFMALIVTRKFVFCLLA